MTRYRVEDMNDTLEQIYADQARERRALLSPQPKLAVASAEAAAAAGVTVSRPVRDDADTLLELAFGETIPRHMTRPPRLAPPPPRTPRRSALCPCQSGELYGRCCGKGSP